MSKFWRTKMQTYFARLDFDLDGKITKNDFIAMANRFTEIGKLDAAKSKDLMDTLTKVWDRHLSAVSGPSGMNKDEFVEAMRKSKDTKELRESLTGPLPLFFHAVDSNDDGVIDEDEYKRFFDILNINVNDAPAAFRAIDTDHDNRLTLKEFIDAGTEFFTNENESCPTQGFWGPLV